MICLYVSMWSASVNVGGNTSKDSALMSAAAWLKTECVQSRVLITSTNWRVRVSTVVADSCFNWERAIAESAELLDPVVVVASSCLRLLRSAKVALQTSHRSIAPDRDSLLLARWMQSSHGTFCVGFRPIPQR